MKVKVKLLRENKIVEVMLGENAKVRDLVHELGFTIEDVIVLKDEMPLIEDEVLEEDAEYVIMPVASGG
ncbi:MAG: thiamine biosynthesis protein ThiS [Thermoprotei archaeon]|nr:MAG: thiamine biosynthesis protein ThiS [Thermoprotei archaeon]